jgi:hypothetical protein
MRLYEEIYEEYAQARCSFVPFGGGYFQGVKNILFLSDNEILLDFKKREARIVGEGLQIAKYCDGDIRVTGKIYSVECVFKGEGGA